MKQPRWPAALLPVFVAAGLFKASPAFSFVPFDLTLALGAVIALAGANAVVRSLRLGEQTGLGWVLGGACVVAVGAFRAPDLPYADTKVLALAALTLGCAFAGAILLVRTAEQRAWLMGGTVAVGLAVAVLYWLAPSTDVTLYGRIALEGSDTIAPGRYGGAALVVLVVLTLARKVRLVVAAPVAVVLLVLIFGSGSKGPLVAAVIALVALVPLMGRMRRHGRAVFTLAAVAALGVYLFGRAGAAARARFELLLADDRGVSVTGREHLWAVGWDTFEAHPLLGIGWGGLEPLLPPLARYPHNAVVEVAGEAGLLGLLGFVALVVVAYRRVYAQARTGDLTAVCLVALLTFWLVNAMVSGDLNSNRGLFVMAGACVALRQAQAATAGIALKTAVVAER